jgi:carbon-monoxide dehydrogenase large subunit
LSHGQGHATSYAQIAADITTLPMARIRVRQGDTAATPYGNGTVASRSIVMGGGAVRQACQMLMDKARRIAAANLADATPETVRVENGALHGPQGQLSLADVARISTVQLHKLPKTIEPGMSVQAFYRPEVETGTFSYAVHAARVEVDTATGFTSLTDYLVVEDCGTLINPLIVDGQITGGVAQGIGQALYESMRYNADGQPQTVTFGDYPVPSAMEVPTIDIIHLHTPSPFSAYGVKGMGEGSSVPPPAAIANAVRTALLDLDIAVNHTPIRPDALLAQLMDASGASQLCSCLISNTARRPLCTKRWKPWPRWAAMPSSSRADKRYCPSCAIDWRALLCCSIWASSPNCGPHLHPSLRASRP